jgi:hypothetical protein
VSWFLPKHTKMIFIFHIRFCPSLLLDTICYMLQLLIASVLSINFKTRKLWQFPWFLLPLKVLYASSCRGIHSSVLRQNSSDSKIKLLAVWFGFGWLFKITRLFTRARTGLIIQFNYTIEMLIMCDYL